MVIRNNWLAKPRTFLLLKKPGSACITAALHEIGRHLSARDDVTLIVEPAVYEEMRGGVDSGRGDGEEEPDFPQVISN
jgi:hypothetical protein